MAYYMLNQSTEAPDPKQIRVLVLLFIVGLSLARIDVLQTLDQLRCEYGWTWRQN